MPRAVLEENHIHPAIRRTVAEHQQPIVQEVIAAVGAHPIVVVGMRLNPFPKKACKSLDLAMQKYTYLEYGHYASMWRERNALKLWSGWPTFPMVFVRGVLVGGAEDVARLVASGELKTLLSK